VRFNYVVKYEYANLGKDAYKVAESFYVACLGEIENIHAQQAAGHAAD
jgi:hypothetical protein